MEGTTWELEMTRQRIRVSLLDSMSEECPTCHGSGRIISQETLVTRIDHWLRRYKSKHRSLRLQLELHPENAEYLSGEKKHILRGLMWQNFTYIKTIANNTIGRDEFKFFDSKNTEQEIKQQDIERN